MEFTGERMIPDLNKGEVVWAEHYARYIFASQFVRNKVVLDVSCGSGYGTLYLAENGGARRVCGVDISKESVQYAKRHYSHPRVEYLAMDAQNLKLGDALFDVVVSFETIEHLPDPEKSLRELKRVLRKDGLLIISTPNKKVYPPGNKYHLKEFTFDEFQTALKSNFKNVKFLYQDDWIANGVLNPKTVTFEDLHKKTKGTDLFKLARRDPKDSLYFVALCSDNPLTRDYSETAVLYTSAIRVDEWVAKLTSSEEREKRLKIKIDDLEAEAKTLEAQVVNLRRDLAGVYNSRSWRLLAFLRRVKSRIPVIKDL